MRYNTQNPLPGASRHRVTLGNIVKGHCTPYIPYVNDLKARRAHNNDPRSVAICVGVSAWTDAKRWQKSPNSVPLVLLPGVDPAALTWPVKGLLCYIYRSIGPDDNTIINLAQCLREAGALGVVSIPLWVDLSTPIWEYDRTRPLDDRWVQIRECIRVYEPKQEVINDA